MTQDVDLSSIPEQEIEQPSQLDAAVPQQLQIPFAVGARLVTQILPNDHAPEALSCPRFRGGFCVMSACVTSPMGQWQLRTYPQSHIKTQSCVLM